MEKVWATKSEFALKLPVLIAFAMVVGTSTWHHLIESSIFITIATPNAFDCFNIRKYVSHGLAGKFLSNVADSFNIICCTSSGIFS